MAAYQVQNQWGGASAPWHHGFTMILGGRLNQLVEQVDLKSTDNGETFSGSMIYTGEGPISVRAKLAYANVYSVEVQWGGSSAPWHNDGNWIIGGRDNQHCVQLSVKANSDCTELNGEMTYQGEGTIGFKGQLTPCYKVENQWGGSSAPWHNGGTWVLTGRYNQNVIAMDITSNDNGKTFEGTMQYEGEGPIGFKGTQISGNNYEVCNQWGGSTAEWHRGGDMIIGCRDDQRVIKLSFNSSNGQNLTGQMTYQNEGPIGFKAELSQVSQLSMA